MRNLATPACLVFFPMSCKQDGPASRPNKRENHFKFEIQTPWYKCDKYPLYKSPEQIISNYELPYWKQPCMQAAKVLCAFDEAIMFSILLPYTICCTGLKLQETFLAQLLSNITINLYVLT